MSVRRHQSGSCWVMQWNEPPPASRARSPRDGRPMTLRSGNSRCERLDRVLARTACRRSARRRAVGDEEVHVGGRARRRRLRLGTRPGQGMRMTSSLRPAASVAAASAARDLVPAPRRWDRRRRRRLADDAARRDEAGEVVDVAVGVVVAAGRRRARGPSWRRTLRAARLRPAPSVQPLRLGLSRNCRVVSTVPSPSWSSAPPSRMKSVARSARPTAAAMSSPTSCRRQGRTCRPSR